MSRYTASLEIAPPARLALLVVFDIVEKLDFLPRSQFLRQQAGFKKKPLRGRQKG
jgi:hypothetical protein